MNTPTSSVFGADTPSALRHWLATAALLFCSIGVSVSLMKGKNILSDTLKSAEHEDSF